MNAWWEALSVLQKVLYCIAVPATLILILQTVMVIIGFGDGDGGADFNPSDTSGLDLDVPADVSADISTNIDAGDVSPSDFGSLKLFTMQGVVAFFTTFSWVSLVLVKTKMPEAAALLLGFVCGAVMMYAVAKLLWFTARLAENGTFRLKSVIGEAAQVYVTVLPSGENGGKVTLKSSSRFAELDAITEGTETIPTGSTVRIVDVRGDVVVVEKE